MYYKILLWMVCLNIIVNRSICHPTLKIGAIFDVENAHQEAALAMVKEELELSQNLTIEFVFEHLDDQDPFAAMLTTCDLLEKGVVGILGPTLDHNWQMVQSICDEKDIPLVDVRWMDQPANPIINFYPYQNVLTQLYIDVLKAWDYTDFVIFYEGEESLRRVRRIMEQIDQRFFKIELRQLDKFKMGNYRPVLKAIRKTGATHMVLDCSTEILPEVLKQAQEVGLMSDRHYYLITNLNLQTLELSAFQYSDTNITGFRIFDPEDTMIKEVAWKVFASEISTNPLFNYSAAWKLELETVLIIDAMRMFGKVFQELPDTTIIPTSINCDASKPWLLGTTIINLLKGVRYSGLSGNVEFDVKGYRNNFWIDVIELMEGGITKVGNWTLDKKLQMNRTEMEIDDGKTLKDKHFKVLISLVEPFAMYTPTEQSMYGNSRYQGYAIDLIHELSLIEGFNYTFINQKDKKNGDFNKDLNKWEGMIGEIREDKADLAIADLTITSERQNAVDFTTPFMNLGISILYQKPRKAPPNFFSFADPFALEVWMLVALSFFTVSIVLFILGRICSSEWSNPYPCIEEPEFLENQLSLRNCFWFVSGSIMQQGTEIGPIAVSTRMVAGMWWFFTLIMVSSYTANLAAFLTTENPDPHFNNVFELVANAPQKGIKWGAKKGGSTVLFFNGTRLQYPQYGEIYDFMMENADDVLVSDPKIGVERAEKENYAFFMEITSIEYEIQRRCNLTSVGGLLDEKSYGIAMKQNSTYRNVLSRAILSLQHTGKLDELKRKWWEEKRGGGFCSSEDEQTDANALTLKNVGGVFWVTMGGVLLAILMVVVELLLHAVKESLKTKIPLSVSLLEEFKFYFRFSGMVKPVIYNNSDEISRKSN